MRVRRFLIVTLAGTLCILHLLGGIQFAEGSVKNSFRETAHDRNLTKVLLEGFRVIGSPPMIHESMGEICNRFDVHSTTKINRAGRCLWGWGRPRRSLSGVINQKVNMVKNIMGYWGWGRPRNTLSDIINYKVNMVKNVMGQWKSMMNWSWGGLGNIINFKIGMVKNVVEQWENILNRWGIKIQSNIRITDMAQKFIDKYLKQPENGGNLWELAVETSLDVVVKTIDFNFPHGYPGKPVVDAIIQIVRDFLQAMKEGKGFEEAIAKVVDTITSKKLPRLDVEETVKIIIVLRKIYQELPQGTNVKQISTDVVSKVISEKFPEFQEPGVVKIINEIVVKFLESVQNGKPMAESIVHVGNTILKKTNVEGLQVFVKWIQAVVVRVQKVTGKKLEWTEIMKSTVKVISDVYHVASKRDDVKAAIVGQLVVRPAQEIDVEVSSDIAVGKIDTGVVDKISKDMEDVYNVNWNSVQGVEFPRMDLLLMTFPNNLIAVVDRETKEIHYITRMDMGSLSSRLSYTLYISLKVITAGVGSVLESMPPCYKSKPMKISTLETGGGRVCGTYYLSAVNNAIITEDDTNFLVVKTPWTLNNLNIALNRVKVNDAPMVNNVSIIISHVNITGTVTFQGGPLLRFVHIQLDVDDDLTDMEVEFPGTTLDSEVTLTLKVALKPVIMKGINKILDDIEKEAYDLIATLGTRGYDLAKPKSNPTKTLPILSSASQEVNITITSTG